MIDFALEGSIWDNLILALRYIYISSPVWLPIFLGAALFKAWVSYRREVYWQSMGQIMLEIKLPREIFKSPAAMEVILGALHQTADESGWYFQYWKGQTRSWFSLEIASIEGKIHFYIWARKKYKTSIENHIYSQYPGAEVYEVEDYTKPFYYDSNLHNLWACEWKLTQPDPFPIKTYVDYGLEKDPKEEFKVDPM